MAMENRPAPCPDPGQSLWHVAGALYAQPGVREICLDWQSRYGADIPLVLALCWQAGRGCRNPEPDRLQQLREGMEPWRRSTVLRLRSLRTRLRPLSPPGSRTGRLRAVILDTELLAERIQLHCLAHALMATAVTENRSSAARRILAIYLGQLGVEATEREDAAGQLVAAITPLKVLIPVTSQEMP